MKAYLEIEMPESCYYCPIANDGFYLCKATSPFKELEDDCEECKPQWCPLIPIQPHGRLIDADALEQEAQERLLECDKYDNQFQKPFEIMRAIRLAPVIIAADMEWKMKNCCCCDDKTIIPAEEGDT